MRPTIKRLLDVLLAAAALVLLAPLLAATALAVRMALGSPVLFRQRRTGHGLRPVTILKFRTMREALDEQGNALSDAARLTRLGRLLRRTSLDELPQLWNVLRGELSLVGPRPLLERYLPYMTADEQRRYSVLPGLTGWAQLRGRNRSSWDQRLRDDLWYVDHWSLGLDLWILLLTPLKLIACRGVVTDPRAVMLNFDEERSLAQAGAMPAQSAVHQEAAP